MALNEGFDGDLTADQTVRLTAGLGHGMGGSGCICGALSAASVALGCFLGNGRFAPGGDARALAATTELHRRFKADFHCTCCRVLTRGVEMGSCEQFEACAGRTGRTAELAAQIILENRPQLRQQINIKAIRRRDGRLSSWLKIGTSTLRGWSSRILLVAVLLAGIGCSDRETTDASQEFEAKAQWAADAFDAPVMTQSQLRDMLGAADAQNVLLVDTRSAEEYQVSHLPNAVLWSGFKDGEPPPAVLAHARSGRPVVFYCSIGYRSGMAAERVARQIGTDQGLFNLKGGIFQWANEGRDLEGGPLVHGYDEEWSRLLNPDLRAEIR